MVAGMRFGGCRTVLKGVEGGWREGWRGFGGSVAVFGANTAEKHNKTMKKSCFLDRCSTLGEKNGVQRGPKGAKKKPKSIQKVIKNQA